MGGLVRWVPQSTKPLDNDENMTAPHDTLQEYVIGYPKLAAKIEILPEFAIFRRFGALNAQNLLYMQAELAYLEKKLKEQQRADSNDPSGKRSVYAVNWFWLKASEDTDADEQLKLILRIREVLKEYSPWKPHAKMIKSLY